MVIKPARALSVVVGVVVVVECGGDRVEKIPGEVEGHRINLGLVDLRAPRSQPVHATSAKAASIGVEPVLADELGHRRTHLSGRVVEQGRSPDGRDGLQVEHREPTQDRLSTLT